MNKKIYYILSFMLMLLIISGCNKIENSNNNISGNIANNTGNKNTEICSQEFNPICAEVQLQEHDGSYTLTEQTFPNECIMIQENKSAIFLHTGECSRKIDENWNKDKLMNKEYIEDTFGLQIEKRRLQNSEGYYDDYLGSFLVEGTISFENYCNMGSASETGYCPEEEKHKSIYINVNKTSNKFLYDMTGFVFVNNRIGLGCVEKLPQNLKTILLTHDTNIPIILKLTVEPFGGLGFGPGDCWSPVYEPEVYSGNEKGTWY